MTKPNLAFIRSFLLRLWRWGLPSFLLLLSLGSADHQVSIYLYGGGSFSADDEVRLEYSVPRRWATTLELYRIDTPEKLLELGGPQNLKGVNELGLSSVRTLELDTRSRNDYSYGEVNLGRLPLGLYYALLKTDRVSDHETERGASQTASATLVLVTDLGLVVKADQDTILTYTAHLPTSTAQRASVYLLKGDKLYAEGLADPAGLTEFTVEDANGLLVAARHGDAWVFSESYWQSWGITKARVYVHTDRSVYRPGHTVYFKGTARSPSGLSPLKGEEALVMVQAADGTEVLRETYTTDAYGSFDSELTLGVEPPLGQYSVETRVLGETFYSSFSVEEFQKPEYRVNVTAGESVAVQGEMVNFTVDAEYLFGGPVAGGQVTYAVLTQPHYRWRYRSSYGFYEDYSYPSYGGEMIERGEGVLNEDGTFSVEVALPPQAEDYQLTLQAGVTDEARREITGTGSLVVYRSGVSLNVTTERYASEVGEEVTVTVEAEDIRGEPVSVAFDLLAERYYWRRTLGEGRDMVRTWQGQTDANGVAVLRFKPEQQGSYTLTARARDDQGRETEAQRYLWVSDGSRWTWAYDGLSIEADKPEYIVGEIARLVIQSPVADANLLITREGDALYDYEIVKLNGSVLTYEVTITEDMSPNSFFSVSLMGEGEYYLQTVGLRVPPKDKFLNVEITSNAETYKPQDTGRFALRVSDATGESVRAQVALALVDEAIYLVRPDTTPDIRGFFYALKSNVVGTQIGQWFYFGEAEALNEADALAGPDMSARAPMDDAVFGQSKAELAPAELRDEFRDTILWLPTLETDDDGLATVEVSFPDNLTEWRLTARAITLGDEVGQDSYKVKTTLPVIARLAAPRFFIRGDEASLRVIGQNNLASEQQGQLELSAELLTLSNPGPQSATLPAGGRVTGDFGVTATQTGSASLTASALTPEASDAMKIPVPVLPHGVREDLGWAGSGSSNWTFTLPSTMDPNTAGGTLYLTPSLAAAVSPALSYLAGYPYGCTEQTMSRFLPSVLAAQAGDLAQLPEDIAENLDDIVQTGLKRLYDFQHEDGGWGFWQYDSSSIYISAYVVNGLLDAKAAGFTVRENVLEWGVEYLSMMVRERGSSDADHAVVEEDGRAYAYYALARAGHTTDKLLDGLLGQGRLTKMSPYGLSLSVLALNELEHTTEANLFLDELLARITERDRVAFWDTDAPRYYWNDDDIEATAYALHALTKVRPEHDVIPKVVNWLLLQRQGARWVSTKDTAAVIGAALSLAEAKGEEAFDYAITVTLNGEALVSRRIQGQSSSSLQLDLSDLRAGDNELNLDVTGEGTLYASAGVHFVAERDYLEPQTKDFTITRTYETLVPVFDRREERFTYKRKPLKNETAVGDYVLVTVELDPKDAYQYVLINEPLPAGYRVVENDQALRVAGLEPRYGYDYYGWNYWYDGRDVRDERVDYYFTRLSDKVTFTYILRAETPGSFTALPTQAWLMYQPEVRGVGTQAALTVVTEE